MSAFPPLSHPHAFLDLLPGELDHLLVDAGVPKWRGRQLRNWVYEKLTADFARMSSFARQLQVRFAELLTIAPASIVRQQRSSDGVFKLLLEWSPGHMAETVMIPDGQRRTACVSSQVGCPVGCRFCASGMAGLKGNLTPGQIVEQIFRLNILLAPAGDRITNIVFMGMGEPLANYAAVIKAIRILNDPECFNLSARRITLSTVGVPQRMAELAEEDLPINLAISLHAPNEPLRRQLIPWADHFSLDDILDAARGYFERTGREITLEYILLSGINDGPEHARELARLCRTLRANVNLIRYNEVPGIEFRRPIASDVERFQRILREAGINAHIRKSRGRDIDAACGQLRRQAAAEQSA